MNDTQAPEDTGSETPRAAEAHEGPTYTRSPAMGQLATALAKAQGEMEPAIHDSQNPHFKSTYASQAACRAVTRGPLSTNGIALLFGTLVTPEVVRTTLHVHHASGEWFETTISMPHKGDAHSIGSAKTYGQRYLYGALGVVTDSDDDGNAAMGRPAAPEARPAPRREPPAPQGRKEVGGSTPPGVSTVAGSNPAPKAQANGRERGVDPAQDGSAGRAPTSTTVDPGTGEPMSDELGSQITAAFRALGYGKGPEPANICKQVTGKAPRNAQGGSNLDQADGLRLLAYLKDEAAKKGVTL